MTGKQKLYAVVLGLGIAGAALAAAPDPAALEAREAALAAQLRCVVCQNQTVAESRAPIAQDMRAQIHAQLAQGQTDAQVVAFFEQRYGSFVRYNPPWRPSTWLLWLAPFAVALLGLWALRRSLRRSGTAAAAPGLTADEKQRVAQWLARPDGEPRP